MHRFLKAAGLVLLTACTQPPGPAPAPAPLPLPPTSEPATPPSGRLTAAEVETFLAGKNMTCKNRNGSTFGVQFLSSTGLILRSQSFNIKGDWKARDGGFTFRLWHIHAPVSETYIAHVLPTRDGVRFGSDRCTFF